MSIRSSIRRRATGCSRLLSAAAALVALATLLGLGGCFETSYLAQQGIGQLALMHSRRRITEVLADPTVPQETKRRLRLARSARDFGVEVLGLRGGDAYTRFVDTHGAPLAYNVWAAPKLALTPYAHHFPIAGTVPYLGYFKKSAAIKEARRLKARGLDVFVGEVAGYSTLGVTSDPIFSSMLEGSDARIVEVVLHEMLHGTLYLPGHSEWNESLAEFVGMEGAALYFRMTGKGEQAARQVFTEARARSARDERFSAFLRPVLTELKALYASPRPAAEKLKLREQIFARACASYRREFPTQPGKPRSIFATGPLNNAVLVVFDVYHGKTTDHARILARLGGDLAAFIRLYKHAVKDEDDPLGYLKKF